MQRQQTSRWTSRPPRRGITFLAVAALLTAAALAWTLPAAVSKTRPAPKAGAAKHKPKGPARPRNWVGAWSRPFRVMAPAASDLIPPLVAVAPGGQVAVTAGFTNEDAANDAKASLISGSAADRFGKRTALGAQQSLAAAYLNDKLVLLTATSPAGQTCCTSAGIQTAASGAASATAGAASAAQTFVTGLDGPAYGALVPVRGGLLAVVDNQAGISVARSDANASFGTGVQLAAQDATPPLMGAARLAGGGAVVAWTAPGASTPTVTGTTTSPGASSPVQGYDQPQNQLIEFAIAGAAGLPGAPRLAVRVPSGRRIDALALVPHNRGATVAWTESWYRGSRYVSEVFWADLKAHARVHALTGAGRAAVGLAMAASSRGRQVLAWQSCSTRAGTCTAEAALRPHGRGWARVRTLGPVDPSDFPVATQSGWGQSLVGWISHGVVYARAAKPGAGGFYARRRVARTGGDSQLALSFGSGQRALAVWIQGTARQSLVGARFTP